MKPFLDEDFLLQNDTARQLYHETAAVLPICDFHCHIDAAVLAADKPFRDLADAWLGGDHYKWRAMRQAGIPERLITGAADPEEKFMAWASVMPDLIGNPLYHWTHLELQRYFKIDEPLTPDSAAMIWQKANDCLSRPEWQPRALLHQLGVKILCTTDDPVSTLPDHAAMAGQTGDLRVVPAFRPDRFIRLLMPDFPQAVQQLADRIQAGTTAQTSIGSLDELVDALRQRALHFHAAGCRLSDHALEYMPIAPASRLEAGQLFSKRLAGSQLTIAEAGKVQFVLLLELASIYDQLGWTMQLHMAALRNTSRQYYQSLGPDTGFDAIQDLPVASPLAALLDACQQNGHLPRTLLYSLNDGDNLTLATIAGTFAKDGERCLVSPGPAWWFHDQKDGILTHLRQYAQVGVLANYIGMTTDSRSLLSYTRHEYFRRILCNLLGEWVENGEYPSDRSALDHLIRRICWQNAADLFSK